MPGSNFIAISAEKEAINWANKMQLCKIFSCYNILLLHTYTTLGCHGQHFILTYLSLACTVVLWTPCHFVQHNLVHPVHFEGSVRFVYPNSSHVPSVMILLKWPSPSRGHPCPSGSSFVNLAHFWVLSLMTPVKGRPNEFGWFVTSSVCYHISQNCNKSSPAKMLFLPLFDSCLSIHHALFDRCNFQHYSVLSASSAIATVQRQQQTIWRWIF